MVIGEVLREAREAKGLSLDEIQEMTKIQKRYLVAIEQNEFNVLPGRFYARAFIKEYAQAVGLDPTELLADFDEDKIEIEDEETVQYSRLEKSRRPKVAKSSSIFSLLPSVIVIILVIGIIFVAWTLYQRTLLNNEVGVDHQPENDEIIRSVEEPESEEPIGSDDEEDEEEIEEEPEAEEPVETNEANFTIVDMGTGNSPTSTLAFEYTEDPIVVQLEAAGESYIEIRGDSGINHYVGTLQPGDSEQIEITGETRIYFNVGNTTRLAISMNEVALEYPVENAIHQKLWINLEQQEQLEQEEQPQN